MYSTWRTVAEAVSASASRCAGSTISISARSGACRIRSGPTACRRERRCRAKQLDLQVGEKVRVKPYKDIVKTLDSNYRNRGLYFDAEMVPFTEREYEVERRQKQIIDEASGKMIRFKTDAIILKDVVCEARYAICRRFCRAAIYPYWREIWLERVPGTDRNRLQAQVRTTALSNRGAEYFCGEQGL